MPDFMVIPVPMDSPQGVKVKVSLGTALQMLKKPHDDSDRAQQVRESNVQRYWSSADDTLRAKRAARARDRYPRKRYLQHDDRRRK